MLIDRKHSLTMLLAIIIFVTVAIAVLSIVFIGKSIRTEIGDFFVGEAIPPEVWSQIEFFGISFKFLPNFSIGFTFIMLDLLLFLLIITGKVKPVIMTFSCVVVTSLASAIILDNITEGLILGSGALMMGIFISMYICKKNLFIQTIQDSKRIVYKYKIPILLWLTSLIIKAIFIHVSRPTKSIPPNWIDLLFLIMCVSFFFGILQFLIIHFNINIKKIYPEVYYSLCLEFIIFFLALFPNLLGSIGKVIGYIMFGILVVALIQIIIEVSNRKEFTVKKYLQRKFIFLMLLTVLVAFIGSKISQPPNTSLTTLIELTGRSFPLFLFSCLLGCAIGGLSLFGWKIFLYLVRKITALWSYIQLKNLSSLLRFPVSSAKLKIFQLHLYYLVEVFIATLWLFCLFLPVFENSIDLNSSVPYAIQLLGSFIIGNFFQLWLPYCFLIYFLLVSGRVGLSLNGKLLSTKILHRLSPIFALFFLLQRIIVKKTSLEIMYFLGAFMVWWIPLCLGFSFGFTIMDWVNETRIKNIEASEGYENS